VRTIPEQTTLRALFVAQDGTAYVDLSETIKDTFPGGIKAELFAIFSIVNSLILNIPEIDSVKILVGGNEAMTLAGHVELRFPFNANMLLIR
jgi:spore germination protein GerM